MLIFHKDYLETDRTNASYVCSREQARAILAKKTRIYKQDTELAGHDGRMDLTSKGIAFANGTITIGCTVFSKKEIARVRKWLKKSTNKKGAK